MAERGYIELLRIKELAEKIYVKFISDPCSTLSCKEIAKMAWEAAEEFFEAIEEKTQ